MTILGLYWIVLFCFLDSLTLSNGQDLLLTLDPDSFLPSVTPRVTVTCTVTSPPDTPTGPTVIIMQLGRQRAATRDERTEDKKEGVATRQEDQGHPETSDVPEDSEELLVTLTPGAQPTLNAGAAQGSMEAEGGISPASSNLSLTLRSLSLSDAGIFVCHASLLNHVFHVQQLTATANLTIIDNAGSAALLLAKEQMLESEHRQLEMKESAVQEELHKAMADQLQLQDTVRHLQSKNDNLTVLVQDLFSSVAKLKSSNSNGVDSPSESSVAEDLQILHKDLDDVKTTVDKLLNVLYPSLTARTSQLELQNEVSSVKAERQLMNDDSKRQGNIDDDERSEEDSKADFQDLQTKVDFLEKDKDRLSEHLAVLEKTVVPELKGHLEDLEKTTLKILVQKMNSLTEQQALQSGLTEKIQSKIDQFELAEKDNILNNGNRISNVNDDYNGNHPVNTINDSTNEKEQFRRNHDDLPAMQVVPPEPKPLIAPEAQLAGTRQCHVCGDVGKAQPCTIDDLRTAASRRCPVGADFCLNDIVQEEHSRQIYKRCASHADCEKLDNTNTSPDCVSFTFMSRGQFTCHFCCASDHCNINFKPSTDRFQG